MKKIIAMLTVTAVLCSFVSCGDNSDDEKESTKSSKKSALEVLEEKLENTQDGNLSRNASYEEIINMVIDYMNNNDIEGLMKISFPDKYVDIINLIPESIGISIDEMMMNSEELDKTSRLVEIVSAEPLPSEDLDYMVEMYRNFEPINQYIEENGKDNIDLEELDTFLYEYEEDGEEISELYFEVPDVQIVNCLIESTSSTGETETSEMNFAIYYIDGEGWKADSTFAAYFKQSKQMHIKSNASTLTKSVMSAFEELDEDDIVFPDCIISSDYSKNYNISDDYVSLLEETIEVFFGDYRNYECIIEIKDNAVVNLAIIDPEEPDYIGVYPPMDDLYGEEYSLDDYYYIFLDDLQY